MIIEGSLIGEIIKNDSEREHLLKLHDRWMNASISEDYPLVADTSKSILECIFKTIINDRVSEEKTFDDIGRLFKGVREVLALSEHTFVAERLTRVSNTIVQNIAEIRNNFGEVSHGADGRFQNSLGNTDAVFLHRLTDALGSFLLLRHRQTSDPNLSTRPNYNDQPEFNDWLDEQYSGFPSLDESTIPYSEVLFKVDPMGYREMCLQYIASESEDADIEE